MLLNVDLLCVDGKLINESKKIVDFKEKDENIAELYIFDNESKFHISDYVRIFIIGQNDYNFWRCESGRLIKEIKSNKLKVDIVTGEAYFEMCLKILTKLNIGTNAFRVLKGSKYEKYK